MAIDSEEQLINFSYVTKRFEKKIDTKVQEIHNAGMRCKGAEMQIATSVPA
jgi:hypothetical protein